MAAVEIVRDPASREPYPASARMAQKIQAEALKRGAIVYASGGQVNGAGDLIMLGPPLVIAGPTGVEYRVLDAMEMMFPGSSRTGRRFEVQYLELENRRPAALAGISVKPYEVVHASGAPPLALRVSAGDKVVAYSGDTEWTDALLDVARAADLFICEAYTFDKPVKYHLDYRTVMAHRSAFGCKRLVLTHLGPDMLARTADVDAECAYDGLTIEV